MRMLSKSKLIAFRQCPKRLWLEVHHPELREDAAATLASFQVGYAVGDAARMIYDPEQTGAVIDAQKEGYGEAFARSKELLGVSNSPIFEAGFQIPGALAFADVMLPEDQNGKRVWKMVEVKSSTKIKDYHHDDIAIQAFIARRAGVNLKSVALAVIDNSWVYPGERNYQGLLKETDFTAETISRSEEVKAWLDEAQRIVAQQKEPQIVVGDQCSDPFPCGFCNYCNRDLPKAEFPVDWLPGRKSSEFTALVKSGATELRDLPDALLNDKQLRVKRQTLLNEVYFDATGAAADLAPHGFPAYFLDFETISFAVPIWKGTRPYQQIPFQFSLHRLGETGTLTHSAFLDLTGNDPSERFAQTLINACGDRGPVFVYNAAFEKTRMRELADRFPQSSDSLLRIVDRMVDLLPVARERYYHPSQHGNWSIKAVLPAAIPELSYDQLEGVKNGDLAMAVFCEAIRPDVTSERKAEIESQLLDYCRLDTLAMVRLWQFFSGRSDTPLVDLL